MPIDNLRTIILPYCLERLEDGRYVVLNRNYRPIGFRTVEHVMYEAYPIALRFKGLTPQVAAKLSFDGKSGLEQIRLYGDGCLPTEGTQQMKAYMARLALLPTLKMDDDALHY